MKSYGRFWRAWNRLSHRDSEMEKIQFILSWTNGRAAHLGEMTQAEYDSACKELESVCGYDQERKRHRSICLHLMQELGVNTGDWQCINDFCSHPRICGKVFSQLDISDLEAFERKLRAIKRKGGLRSEEERVKSEESYGSEKCNQSQFIFLSNGNKEKPN